MEEFKIGDYVKIVQKGSNRPDDNEGAKRLGATKFHNAWITGIEGDIFGTIINLEKDLVLIDIGKHEIVIRTSAIKLAEIESVKIKQSKSNKDLFGI